VPDKRSGAPQHQRDADETESYGLHLTDKVRREDEDEPDGQCDQ
jgi:hypothetical protein